MAAPATPPTDPNTLAVMHALTAAGVEPEDAYNATQGVANMAGQAITAALESHKAEIAAKIDSQNARFDALQDQLTRERRIIWTLVVLLGVAVMRFIFGSVPGIP